MITPGEIWNWVTAPILNKINQWSDEAYRIYSSVGDSIKGFVSDQLGYIENGINWVTTLVGNQLSSDIADLKSGIDFIDDELKGYFDTQLKPIGESIVKTSSQLKANFEEGLRGVREEVTAGQETITRYFEEGLRGVAEVIAEIPETLERLTRDGMEALASLPKLFAKLPEMIKEEFEELLTFDEGKLEEYTEKMVKLQERVIKKWQEKPK